MISTSYLLSSSQGLPISKYCLRSSRHQPNWINIARLVAFVSNIFLNENEFYFNDGNLTFFSYQQPLKDGSCYFVTFFSNNDTVNLSSLSRYVAITSTILFQPILESFSRRLEERTSKQIQSNTYHDTIQDGEINDDVDYSDPQHELYDHHDLMDILAVFEEHFIRRLLVSEADISVTLFHFIESYFQDFSLRKENVDKKNLNIPQLKCSIFLLSNEGSLFRILSTCDNLPGSNIIVDADLKSAVLKASHMFSISNQQSGKRDYGSLKKEKCLVYFPSSAGADGSTAGDFFLILQLSHIKHQIFFMVTLPADSFSEDFFLPQTFRDSFSDIESIASDFISIDMLPVDLCETLEKTLVILNKAFFSSFRVDDDLLDIRLYDDTVVSKDVNGCIGLGLESVDGIINGNGNNDYDDDLIDNSPRGELDTIQEESRPPTMTDHDEVEYIPHKPDGKRNSHQLSAVNTVLNIEDMGSRWVRPGTNRYF